MSDPRNDLRRAYDDLVRTADVLYRAVERRLAAEHRSDRPHPDVIASLEVDLASTTQFIDLLESAVSLLVEDLTALSRGAPTAP